MSSSLPAFRSGPFLGAAKKPPPPAPSSYSYTYLLLAGGDTSDPTTLIHGGQLTIQWQVDPSGNLNTVGNPQYGTVYPNYANVGAALIAACLAAGAGKSVVGFSNPPFYQQLTIIFDASVSPRVWYCDNVQASPQVWAPATGLPAGDGLDMAQAPFSQGAVAVFAGPASRYSATGTAFGTPGTPPSQINRFILEPGQAGIYLGAAAGGIVKSIDFGATWGYVRPHVGLGTAWPAGAVGREVCILPAARPQPALAALIVLGTNVYKKLGDDNVWVAIDGVPTNIHGQQLKYFGSGHLLHMTTREGAVRYSGDSGATWATRSVPAPAEDLDSYDLAGDARLWALGKKVAGTDTAYVFFSDNFGAAWTLSFSWTTFTLDVGQISVNQTNSNQIAATYLNASGDVAVQVSSNRGSSWTSHVVDATSTFNPVGCSGRIIWIGSRMIIFYNLTGGNMRMKYSDDFGATWTTALTIPAASGTACYDFIAGTALGPLFACLRKLATVTSGCMLRSVDHGASWTAFDSPFSSPNTVQSLAYDAFTDTLYAEDSAGNIKYLTGASVATAANWPSGFVDVTSPGITAPGSGSTMVLAVN